jgi:hypothetical protein
VVTPRISVEDGAMLKGSIQDKTAEIKQEKQQSQAKPEAPKPPASEPPKALAATASA